MMLFLLILCAVLLILLGGAYYAYRIAFFSPMKGRDQLPSTKDSHYDPYRENMARLYHQLNDRPYETVSIHSHDGLKLVGRYYHVKDGAPLDIGFHGYRSHPMTDFSGGAELSLQREHNLLLVFERSHGESQGRSISFGIQERQDVLNWVYYAVERFGADTKIFLYGVSMGASTVLMASELELPPNVKGIIADCPYASPMEIILHVGRKQPIPLWLVKPFIILGAKIYGGFNIRETDAVRAVKNAKVPILIIHGEADHFVPCEMSDIVSHNPEFVTRYTFPEAAHGISYLVDAPRYQSIVKTFIEKALRS